MSASCGCRPGTYANGWHEERSARCKEVEMDAWRQALKIGRRWRASRGRAQIHN